MDDYLMYGSWELTQGRVANKNGTQEEQSVDSGQRRVDAWPQLETNFTCAQY